MGLFSKSKLQKIEEERDSLAIENKRLKKENEDLKFKLSKNEFQIERRKRISDLAKGGYPQFLTLKNISKKTREYRKANAVIEKMFRDCIGNNAVYSCSSIWTSSLNNYTFFSRHSLFTYFNYADDTDIQTYLETKLGDNTFDKNRLTDFKNSVGDQLKNTDFDFVILKNNKPYIFIDFICKNSFSNYNLSTKEKRRTNDTAKIISTLHKEANYEIYYITCEHQICANGQCVDCPSEIPKPNAYDYANEGVRQFFSYFDKAISSDKNENCCFEYNLNDFKCGMRPYEEYKKERLHYNEQI